MARLKYYKLQIYKALKLVGRQGSWWMFLGIVGTVILGLVELGIAVFIQVFLKSLGLIDPAVLGKSFLLRFDLPPIAIGACLVSLGVVRFLGQYLVNQSGVAAQEGVNGRLRRILSYRILLHPEQSYTAASESNYLLGTIFQSAGLAILFATLATAHALQSTILAIVMLLTSWKEAILGVLGLTAIGLIVMKINRSIRHRVAKVPQENKLLISGIERVASNWLLVRILRTQMSEYARFTQSINTVLKHTLGAASLNNLASSITPLFGIILLVAIVSISQHYWNTSALVLVSFLYLFIRFVQGLAAMVQLLGSTSQYLPQFREAARFFFSFSEENIRQALDNKLASAGSGHTSTFTHQSDLIAAPAIHFSAVSFAYNERLIIQNLSFNLNGGQTLGVIGPSGSGKSTLLLLLLGILEPDKGSVLIGNSEAKSVLKDRKVRIGYVGAEPFLFSGSIKENLLYGLSEVPEGDIWQALAEARLSEQVRNMPGQLDYLISENGDGLSAGQKQRLCLARIFLQQPPLIILDEATANLDNTTELEVVESLSKFKHKATTVIVTHRFSALKYADSILDMKTGSIEQAHVNQQSQLPEPIYAKIT